MCRGHGDSVFNALQTPRRGPAHSRTSGAAPGQTREQLRPGSRTDPAHLRPDLTALAPLERCDERAALWGPETGRRFAAPGASGCQSPRPSLLGGSARPPKTNAGPVLSRGVHRGEDLSSKVYAPRHGWSWYVRSHCRTRLHECQRELRCLSNS